MQVFTFATACLGMKIKVTIDPWSWTARCRRLSIPPLTGTWCGQGFYFIEVPLVLRTIFTLMTAFMSAKVRSRFLAPL